MATYKVLQDIEAEDKLLGPLTLKQFVFAAITIGLGFICFLILNSPAPIFIKLPLITPLIPAILVFGFLAAPINRDQPNDIWLLARLRYLMKPHKRIWNQDGIIQLVTITAPKKVVQYSSNGLSQTEVSSRLQALANTVDSRGWAIKNVNTNLFAEPSYLSVATDSDRLVDPTSLPQDTPVTDISAADDMLDTENNERAQKLDKLVHESTQVHKQKARTQMHDDPAAPQTPTNYWFMNQTSTPPAAIPQDLATFQAQPVVAPGSDDVVPAAQASPEEMELATKLAQDKKSQASKNKHLKTLQPLHDREGKIIKQPMPVAPIKSEPKEQRQLSPKPAILELAQNDDLNVATIARQARRIDKDDQEVVISLH
ncbi:MAG: PrgI family protein [bacterium]|nr:PrgI family protein [bacterium]